MDSSELKRRLCIGFMKGLSRREKDFFIKNGTTVSGIMRKNPKVTLKMRDAEDSLRWLNESGEHKVWWSSDAFFPMEDDERSDLPYMIFVKGTIPRKAVRSVAIVGTRKTDNMGLQTSYRLGFEAAINSVRVVSGLADGCDQAALAGAAAGYGEICGFSGECAESSLASAAATGGEAPCIAVLGCGLEVPYPSYTEGLKEKIIRCGGAILSEYPPYMPPLPQNFPKRNAIIASLSDSVVVVQAPKRSGALITARLALEMNKDVYVSRAGVGTLYNRAGSMRLVADGAEVISSVTGIYKCKYYAENARDDDIGAFRFGSSFYKKRNLIP